jgi:hypothetical protein
MYGCATIVKQKDRMAETVPVWRWNRPTLKMHGEVAKKLGDAR